MAFDFDTLAAVKDLKSALLTLRSGLAPFGARDLVYGYVLNQRAQLRQDGILESTLSDQLISIYGAQGGMSIDPVVDRLQDTPRPFMIDINQLCGPEGPEKYRNHKFGHAMLSAGYRRFWSCPFIDAEGHGMGALTVYQDERPDAVELAPDLIGSLTPQFHEYIKTAGLIIAEFGLSETELNTLQASALGHAADWIADKEGISVRAIELRLQSARKKLSARNTTEAVYKALAYGALRRRSA